MSIESQQLPQERDNFSKKEISPENYAIIIEREIMARFLKEEPSIDINIWIEKFSEIFRAFFNENETEIISEYQNDPEKAYNLIENYLYKKQKNLS